MRKTRVLLNRSPRLERHARGAVRIAEKWIRRCLRCARENRHEPARHRTHTFPSLPNSKREPLRKRTLGCTWSQVRLLRFTRYNATGLRPRTAEGRDG